MTDASVDVAGKSRLVNIVSLFTSTSTLICCALPALLVAVGAGAALSSLVSAVPQLVWISEHKTPVFAFAGAMLLLAGLILNWLTPASRRAGIRSASIGCLWRFLSLGPGLPSSRRC
jgi:hypothetical protein